VPSIIGVASKGSSPWLLNHPAVPSQSFLPLIIGLKAKVLSSTTKLHPALLTPGGIGSFWSSIVRDDVILMGKRSTNTCRLLNYPACNAAMPSSQPYRRSGMGINHSSFGELTFRPFLWSVGDRGHFQDLGACLTIDLCPPVRYRRSLPLVGWLFPIESGSSRISASVLDDLRCFSLGCW